MPVAGIGVPSRTPIVDGRRHAVRVEVLQLLIALGAAMGTAIQLRLSLMDFGASRKEAVEWWTTEDELVAETPRLKSRRMRRELRSWRDPEIHRTIRDLQQAVASWMLLAVAAALVVCAAAVHLIR